MNVKNKNNQKMKNIIQLALFLFCAIALASFTYIHKTAEEGSIVGKNVDSPFLHVTEQGFSHSDVINERDVIEKGTRPRKNTIERFYWKWEGANTGNEKT